MPNASSPLPSAYRLLPSAYFPGPAMTKIRFIQTAATDRQCFVEGREKTLPDAEAQIHIRAGHAEPVTAPAPAAPPAAAPRPKKTGSN